MNKKVEEMRKYMIEKAFYTLEDIEKICEIEQNYINECEEIAEECETEGYPAHGSNYELRCADAEKYRDEQIAEIDSKYE